MTVKLPPYLEEQAVEPRWREACKVHDWRNYAIEEIRRLWPSFSEEQKFALVEMMDNHASDEEWE